MSHVPVPPAQRAAALCAIAAILLLAPWWPAGSPAEAASAETSRDAGGRASAVNTPLALAGFAVLSSGLLVLGKSRIDRRRTTGPVLLSTAPPATRQLPAPTPSVPRPLPRDPSALAPLAAIAGALHATANALDAVAGELPGPAAGEVAVSAERVREAQVTLARWLESQR
jgi:hypothetical protein